MMNRVILKTIVLLFFFHSFVYADAIIYLKSYVVQKSSLTVADIANVDGDEAELVKNICIPDAALNDRYITKNEVYRSLKNTVAGLLIIHGSAVKLIELETVPATDNLSQELSLIPNTMTISKGDLLTVRLINKSIVIEVIGKALQSGKTGDEIKVSLQSGKIVTGKIVNNGVECYL